MVVAPLALSGTNYSTTSRHGSETLPSLCLPLVYNSPRRIRSPCALGPTWQPSNTARSNFFFAREEGKFKALRFASLWNALAREENRPPVFVVFRCNTYPINHRSLSLSLSSSPRSFSSAVMSSNETHSLPVSKRPANDRMWLERSILRFWSSDLIFVFTTMWGYPVRGELS